MAIKEQATQTVYDSNGKVVADAKIINNATRTVGCDAEGCDKQVSFTQATMQEAFAQNPWLATQARIIKTNDERTLVYCSDECTIKAAATGVMNVPTKKVVELVEGSDALKKAEQLGATVQGVDSQIKKGPVLVK
jgi:hypothetical protein